uniref:Uncharacterized protein n=1 Tax=Rhizophagus irregularis (strain DAOM 181602 / DAOM 197198 / MUCL 43194) TaxID=747089 RepID=U9SWD4_RHIID
MSNDEIYTGCKGFDGTWFRRFLRAVQNLNLTIYDTIKGKLVLKSTLDAEGLGLLNVASRLQSRKITLDYEDQIAKLIPSSDKRSLDHTSANDKSTAKRVKSFNNDESMKNPEQQLQCSPHETQNAKDNTPPLLTTIHFNKIFKKQILNQTDEFKKYLSQFTGDVCNKVQIPTLIRNSFVSGRFDSYYYKDYDIAHQILEHCLAIVEFSSSRKASFTKENSDHVKLCRNAIRILNFMLQTIPSKNARIYLIQFVNSYSYLKIEYLVRPLPSVYFLDRFVCTKVPETFDDIEKFTKDMVELISWQADILFMVKEINKIPYTAGNSNLYLNIIVLVWREYITVNFYVLTSYLCELAICNVKTGRKC